MALHLEPLDAEARKREKEVARRDDERDVARGVPIEEIRARNEVLGRFAEAARPNLAASDSLG